MAPPGFTPGPLIKERDIELDWSPESVQEIKLRSSKKPQVRKQQDPASCADQEALLLSSVKKYPLDFQGLSQGQAEPPVFMVKPQGPGVVFVAASGAGTEVPTWCVGCDS